MHKYRSSMTAALTKQAIKTLWQGESLQVRSQRGTRYSRTKILPVKYFVQQKCDIVNNHSINKNTLVLYFLVET